MKKTFSMSKSFVFAKPRIKQSLSNIIEPEISERRQPGLLRITSTGLKSEANGIANII